MYMYVCMYVCMYNGTPSHSAKSSPCLHTHTNTHTHTGTPSHCAKLCLSCKKPPTLCFKTRATYSQCSRATAKADQGWQCARGCCTRDTRRLPRTCCSILLRRGPVKKPRLKRAWRVLASAGRFFFVCVCCLCCMNMCVCVYTCVCVCMRMAWRSVMHTCMHTYVFIYIYIYIYIYIHTHTHRYTYRHTHTHICMQVCIQCTRRGVAWGEVRHQEGDFE